MRFINYSCLLFTFIAISFGCSKKQISGRPYTLNTDKAEPDYSDIRNWAAHPWKSDPSDSISSPLKKTYKKDSLADVFFLHPTSFTDINDSNWNADIDDTEINEKTDYSSILYQASAFAEKTRVFAPRYRQANLKVYFSADSINSKQALQLAYKDVRSAFEYYLKYLNNGRPVIIVSHSQGTTHAIELIKEFFDGKPLMNQLVCAYLIGMPVADKTFSYIPVCTNEKSTGCYMTWRTYRTGYVEPVFVAKENFKVTVTNPLTWDTSNAYAPASLNKGGILRKFNKVIPHVTDAQIKGNVLWSSKPKFFGNVFLTLKNYHIADINFFYVNIRENVRTRIKSYSEQKRIIP